MNYRLFGTSGLRVSELCLGTMTFGLEWGWGADKDESRKIFDTYADAGGNFVDTANRYTEGTSERWLGEFVKSDRHHFVVATKYTLRDQTGDPNRAGNHRKNMMRSVEESLRRLDTDFIDLFWVHAWDGMTPVDEVLRGLDDLVRSGKVHYIGISDTPAWVVSQANTMAELRGWTSFAGLQIEYSLLQRAPERDLLPMAKHFGMAVTPWGAIGGGALTGKYLKGEAGRVVEASARRSARANAIAAVVVEQAEKLGVPPVQLAINWTRQKYAGITAIPIVGARTAAQLQDSLGCLSFEIPEASMQALHAASAIELGFPHEFLASDNIRELIFGGQYQNIIR
ncbi:MAG: aldo/keto reductase [Saprospiraceae bacterium]|jgi:aryl-alcohol dehydrogenase-like predicted oxidoreductase|nr:aldo/keto reductase [Saprospiraceae bacterium]